MKKTVIALIVLLQFLSISAFADIVANQKGKCGYTDENVTVHLELDGDDALLSCSVARADDRQTAYSVEFTNGEKRSADVVIAGLEPTRYQIKGIAANAFGQYSAQSIEVEV